MGCVEDPEDEGKEMKIGSFDAFGWLFIAMLVMVVVWNFIILYLLCGV